MKRTLCILLAIVTFVGSIVTANVQEVFASDEDNYVCKYLEGKENLTVQEVNANWPTYKILENPEVDTTNLKVVHTETDPAGDVWEALVGYITWRDYSFFFTGWRNKKTGIVLDNLGKHTHWDSEYTICTGLNNQKQLEKSDAESEYLSDKHPGYYVINPYKQRKRDKNVNESNLGELPFNTLPKGGITISYSKKGIVDFKVSEGNPSCDMVMLWKPLKKGSTTVTVKFEDYGCKPIYKVFHFKVVGGTAFGYQEYFENNLKDKIPVKCVTYKMNGSFKVTDKRATKNLQAWDKTYGRKVIISEYDFGKDAKSGKQWYPLNSYGAYTYNQPIMYIPRKVKVTKYRALDYFYDVNVGISNDGNKEAVKEGYHSVPERMDNTSNIYPSGRASSADRELVLPEIVKESNNEFSKDFVSRLYWQIYKVDGESDLSAVGEYTGFVDRLDVECIPLKRLTYATYADVWQKKTQVLCLERASLVRALATIQNDFSYTLWNSVDNHIEAVTVINGFHVFNGTTFPKVIGWNISEGSGVKVEKQRKSKCTEFRLPNCLRLRDYCEGDSLLALIAGSLPEYKECNGSELGEEEYTGDYIDYGPELDSAYYVYYKASVNKEFRLYEEGSELCYYEDGVRKVLDIQGMKNYYDDLDWD